MIIMKSPDEPGLVYRDLSKSETKEHRVLVTYLSDGEFSFVYTNKVYMSYDLESYLAQDFNGVVTNVKFWTQVS